MGHGELPVPEELVRAPASKLSLIHFSPTDPLFCCCPRRRLDVTPMSNTGRTVLSSTYLILITKEIGALTKPLSRTCRPSSHTHLIYATVVRAAIAHGTPSFGNKARASFALDALLACLSPYAAKALILISLLVRSPPLCLSYVCDACRPCHETPAVALCNSLANWPDHRSVELRRRRFDFLSLAPHGVCRVEEDHACCL